MIRQDRLLKLGLGWCAVMLGGCASSLHDRKPAVLAPAAVLARPEHRQDAANRPAPASSQSNRVSPRLESLSNDGLIQLVQVNEPPQDASRPPELPPPATPPVSTEPMTPSALPQEVPPSDPTALRRMPEKLTDDYIEKKKLKPIVLAMYEFMAGRHEQAAKLLDCYDRETRELFLRLLPLTAHLSERDLRHAEPHEITALLDQMENLAMLVRPRSELVIDKMCFCRQINGFGNFVRLPDDYIFQAGCDGRPGEMVKIYLEVRNFTSEVQGEHYVTRLGSSLKIRDNKGVVVWEKNFPGRDQAAREPSDRSRTQRRDYFINYQFPIPAHLPCGRYTLSVEIVDLLSKPNRTATRSLPFPVLMTTCVRGYQGEESSLVGHTWFSGRWPCRANKSR